MKTHSFMKMYSLYCWLAFICFIAASCNNRPGRPLVLVFTKTAGFHHASIPAGVNAILNLGKRNNFIVDTTSNADWFCEDNLKKYSAVIFLNTTGNLLNNRQEADFERYIQAGGGYVGIHAATDAEYDWGWYGRLAGGYFNGHPAQQEAVLKVVDPGNISTKHLPLQWKRKDEWYNFKKLNKDIHVLLTIDEKTYTGGTNGDYHPMAWYHDYDGGRAWYTELGHKDESYVDSNYLKHILGGIEYAIGDNKKLNYDKATTLRVPEEERFTKTSLVEGVFFEPTEMTILPNLDILVAQRHGEIMLYKNETKKVKQIGFLDVYWKTKHTPRVNAEEGLLGIQADPDFKTNNFVYVYYSPSDTSVNRLSRFTLINDSIDIRSEKIILQLYSQREICCHTGGSIAFGKDNDLFLSTGDNSTPFDEPNTPYASHGFGPMDDRPGHTQYDSRRSAANTNDLRGKILRIKIKPDGSYDIPAENLFPKGEAGTRPEIFVMGNRNPYRITVDKKNGYLYWGEVGPDATQDSSDTRGPMGYDEINQARKAGFFGWPLFVGNNYAYHAHNYENNANGPAFDPAKPVNDSRNNTGLRELPPAQPAFIWYPYAMSPDFPQLGDGGRCAMAGPVFNSEFYPKDTRMPDYYNGKFFMYDFMRGWFKAVTLQPNGDFDKMEPFMEHTKFNAPIDAEMGPDGRLYVLEYGNGWYTKNADAALSRLDFNNGNVPPKISSISVNKTSGLLPLNVVMTVNAKDLQNDSLTYIWDLGDGNKKMTRVSTLNYIYNKPGEFAVSVEVINAKKAFSKSETVDIYAGNETPVVQVHVKGNKSFYFSGTPVSYTVAVENGAVTDTVKDMNDLVVSADYSERHDKAGISQGQQVLRTITEGRNLMLSFDCKTCHKVSEKSIGPSFTEVSSRYQNDPKMISDLAEKVIKGGSGKWGNVVMPAHPSLKEEDIKQIIGWIQTMSREDKTIKSLPATGSLEPTLHKPLMDKGILTISASYTNKGGDHIRPLTGSSSVSLQNSKVSFGKAMNIQGVSGLRDIDLESITRAELGLEWTKQPAHAYIIELRLDSAGGKKIGTFNIAGSKAQASENKVKYILACKSHVNPVRDKNMHSLFIINKTRPVNSSNETPLISYVKFFNK
jgi:cytochrome c